MWRIWTADYFAVTAPLAEVPLFTDDEFLAVQECALAELPARGIWNPLRYVLNRVAARLSASLMPFEVTDDFVAFFYDEEDNVRDANIRFSASPDALATIEQKRLLDPRE